MGVPYAIVKGKARLGTLVHKKTSSVAALTEVSSADEAELAKLVSTVNANFIEKYEDSRRHWGGGIMGSKANDKKARKQKLLDEPSNEARK
ncbi:60S ribosomal protein L8B [Cerrena zonata]